MEGSPSETDDIVNENATGVLYLIATPIGNLEDITARALRLLREVDVIAAEDTRVTRKLLAHFDIHTPLTAYHAHSDTRRGDRLVATLLEGKSIALVSDAGTPCISDPGAELVEAAIEAGIRVEPIPGANALLSALIASGLPAGRFIFDGFLPRSNDRRERIKEAAYETRTLILYEAPIRLVETLTELAKVCGENRRAAVAREITKKFEEFVRGTLSEIIAHFKATPPRGECVIIIEGTKEPRPEEAPPDSEALLRDALQRGLSPSAAAREVARAAGLPRNAVYARALSILAEPE